MAKKYMWLVASDRLHKPAYLKVCGPLTIVNIGVQRRTTCLRILSGTYLILFGHLYLSGVWIRLDLRTEINKGMCLKEIELHAQTLSSILDSRVDTYIFL